MRYILADKQRAIEAGFLEVAHRVNERVMILNEHELRNASRLSGTLAERAEAVGGELLTQAQTFLKVKRKGKFHITIKQ